MKNNIVIICLVVIIIILFYFLFKGNFCKVNYLQNVNNIQQQQDKLNIDSDTNKGVLPGDNPKDQNQVVLNSGIKGKVVFTSCAGVAQQDQDPVCNKYSGPLTFGVKNSNGNILMVSADKSGYFKETIVPGVYTVFYIPNKGESYSSFNKSISISKDKFSDLEIDIKVLTQ